MRGRFAPDETVVEVAVAYEETTSWTGTLAVPFTDLQAWAVGTRGYELDPRTINENVLMAYLEAQGDGEWHPLIDEPEFEQVEARQLMSARRKQ